MRNLFVDVYYSVYNNEVYDKEYIYIYMGTESWLELQKWYSGGTVYVQKTESNGRTGKSKLTPREGRRSARL